jgi:hypothetical protein
VPGFGSRCRSGPAVLVGQAFCRVSVQCQGMSLYGHLAFTLCELCQELVTPRHIDRPGTTAMRELPVGHHEIGWSESYTIPDLPGGIVIGGRAV